MTVMSKQLHRIMTSPILMVVVALSFRLGVMIHLHSYQMGPYMDHFRFGAEVGRIAQSITSGQGFSSPFHAPTGPTAWVPPVYPYLLAAVFKLFGAYTDASALIILSLNSLFSAMTCSTIFSIGLKTFGPTVAIWAGWIWAVLPSAVYWPTTMVWESSLSTLLLSLIFLLTLHLQRSTNGQAWLGFGLLWGLVALTSPALLSLLPFFGGWLCHRLRRRGATCGRLVGASALAFVLSVTPWAVRNYLTFGELVLIRSNFGLELHQGNQEGATGLRMWWLHPSVNGNEMQKYHRMGEVGYMVEKRREALSFIAEHPRSFALLSLKRVVYFWVGTPHIARLFGFFGRFAEAKRAFFILSSLFAFWGLYLALHERQTEAFLFASLLFVYPVVYYVTHPAERYRHPIEPEMVLLAVYAVRGTIPRHLPIFH